MKITIHHITPEIVEAILNRILDLLPDQGTLPPLYQSHIRYKRENGEFWQMPRETASIGYGDCEDLALYRAYELRKHNIPAKIRVYQSGPKTMHVVVEHPNGEWDDPSRALGMNDINVGETVSQVDPEILALMLVANSVVPGSGIAVQMLKTPEGKRALKSLKKLIKR